MSQPKVTRILIPLGGVGEIKTESKGYPNQECRMFTGPIIAALGGTVTADEQNTEHVQREVVLEGAS